MSVNGLDIKPAGEVIEFDRVLRGSRGPSNSVVCPFEHVLVEGHEAESVLDKCRAARPDTTPVLLGSLSETGLQLEALHSSEDSPEQTIRLASEFNLDEWFAARQSEYEETYEGLDWPPRGEWPSEIQKQTNLTVACDVLTGKFHDQVLIALLPTSDPTEAAAYLNLGGWNECPDTVVHLALAKRWHKTNGAVLAATRGDVIEYRVAQPIATKEEALAMAFVQNLFCTDIVDQGCETIDRLAASLINAPVWYFWWD